MRPLYRIAMKNLIPLPRLGLGMAALGRPGYINLDRGSVFGGSGSRSIEDMQTQANLVLDFLFQNTDKIVVFEPGTKLDLDRFFSPKVLHFEPRCCIEPLQIHRAVFRRKGDGIPHHYTV